jgi:hypothetical protein
MRMSVRVGAALTAASSMLLVGPGLAGARATKGELAPTAKGQVKPKEAHGGGGGTKPSRSPNMTFHGGPIMITAVVQPIFWGTSWNNATAVGDKITGVHDFYVGHNGSNYAKTVDEYTGSNGTVGPNTGTNPSAIDLTAASSDSSGQITFNEVVKEINAGKVAAPDVNGNSYYPVYTDVPRGNAGFCAWHSAGTVGGVWVEFGFFFRLDGDAGCDPQDTTTGHSQGLAALANVSAHELSEARSDPSSPGAWYDGQGQENGDKCAWTFNVASVQFPNQTSWKLQGEWSNSAYTHGTGYPNRSGQKGCLDGH